jgi:hypothetical protein
MRHSAVRLRLCIHACMKTKKMHNIYYLIRAPPQHSSLVLVLGNYWLGLQNRTLCHKDEFWAVRSIIYLCTEGHVPFSMFVIHFISELVCLLRQKDPGELELEP